MALVLGTNCGFCLATPTADPNGGSGGYQDNYHITGKFVAPEGATRITEIGWYCNNATQEANFDVGIFSHDSVNNRPLSLLAHSGNVAKSTDAGWKKASVSCEIAPGEIYWIGAVCNDTATDSGIDSDADATQKTDWITPASTPLPSSWGTSSGTTGRLYAYYAVYEIGTTYTLTCEPGSFALTGLPALLRRAARLVFGPGAFALTGQDVELRLGGGTSESVINRLLWRIPLEL